jgi:hypothetical protein
MAELNYYLLIFGELLPKLLAATHHVDSVEIP